MKPSIFKFIDLVKMDFKLTNFFESLLPCIKQVDHIIEIAQYIFSIIIQIIPKQLNLNDPVQVQKITQAGSYIKILIAAVHQQQYNRDILCRVILSELMQHQQIIQFLDFKDFKRILQEQQKEQGQTFGSFINRMLTLLSLLSNGKAQNTNQLCRIVPFEQILNFQEGHKNVFL